MRAKISTAPPVHLTLKAIVRGNRIHIEAVPSLFSEGIEPDESWLRRQALQPTASFTRALAQVVLMLVEGFAQLGFYWPHRPLHTMHDFNGLGHAVPIRVEARAKRGARPR